jgi:WXG100 family type VII secretion target
MSDIIKMDYALMEEMSQIFRNGADQLEDTLKEMENIANILEGGALLGRGGEAFSDAIKTNLSQSIIRLRDKFEELSRDITGALIYTRDGDINAQSKFLD